MNISEALKQISQKLQTAQIENYSAEAYSLLSFICQKDQSFLISHPEKNINPKQEEEIKKLIKLRSKSWPLAYLMNKKSFYQLEFFVNSDTLIPRPESELIVEAVLKECQKEKQKKINIIDVGTGSGCLIISLAHILQSKNNINFYGLDISSPALKVAKKNAQKQQLNKRISFKLGNLLEPLLKKIGREEAQYHILANLPYLTKEEIKNSPSLKMEPKKALDGGKDGLKFYQELFKQISQIKKDNSFFIYAEINPWQKEKLLELTKKAFSECSIEYETILDLRKEARIIIIKI